SLLAFINLVTRKGIDESIVSLKKLLVTLPGRQDLAFMLAQLYLEKGEGKIAREMLEQVVKSSADERLRQDATGLLAQISSIEKAKEEHSEEDKKPEPPATSTDQVVTETTNKPAPPPDPSRYLREVLRQPRPGETQLEGMLVKLECDPKGIVFVVRAGTALLR